MVPTFCLHYFKRISAKLRARDSDRYLRFKISKCAESSIARASLNLKKHLFLILLFSLNLALADGQTESSAWGKIVRLDQTIKGITYKYFIYYEEASKAHAYPIDTDSKEMGELIKKSTGQNVRVTGQVKEVTFNLDGHKKKILVFMPSKISPLTLAELSAPGPLPSPSDTSKLPSKEKAAYDGGGIRINDKVANGLIYTGAAVILGSALKNMLSK